MEVNLTQSEIQKFQNSVNIIKDAIAKINE